MFDIAFSELLVIAVVALVVIGPERLPKVARTLGLLAGRLQRYVSHIKADVERELRVQELQDIGNDMRQSASSVESAVRQEMRQVESGVDAAVQQARDAADKAGPPPGAA